MSKEGIVFNIQRLSIHDGPGIRSTIFLKGCPLHCLWCSNPESQNEDLEIACFPNLCIGCGACADVCHRQIIEKEGTYSIKDRRKCDLCMKCVEECCTTSKQLVGKKYAEEDLLQEILKDEQFYESSGGGVTFSGGEPLNQADFLISMLKKCKENGLNTAIETSGFADTDKLLAVAGYSDLIYYDIKHMDEESHEALTGVSNTLILSNLKELAKVHDNIIVRIPVIPTLNDDVDNIRKTADYAAELSVNALELLPYHNLGESKYANIGKKYTLSELSVPEEDHMKELADEAKSAIGIRETKVDVAKTM